MKNKEKFASLTANTLLRNGMIWGCELEWYIKINAKGLISIKNDEEYFEIENMILDLVEEIKSKMIKVTDIKAKEQHYVMNVHEAVKLIHGEWKSIQKALNRGSIYKKRYKFEYENLKVYEI